MASESALESRVQALEQALSLPSSSSASPALSAQAEVLAAKVDALQTALNKANYRIKHLVRGYEGKVAEVESLRAELSKRS